jgi:hypothetical protein
MMLTDKQKCDYILAHFKANALFATMNSQDDIDAWLKNADGPEVIAFILGHNAAISAVRMILED